MNTIASPLFCVTSDCDWASEYCIEDLVSLLQGYGVRPTIFVTHKSSALERYRASGVVQLGVHPNFLPGSSHGDDYLSIIDHVFGLVPDAETFRSHCFFDHTRICQEMYRREVRYDSNLCLYLQPHLMPLQHGTGLVRFPVFWEDDSHWEIAKGDWDLDKLLPAFLSPGLKILNFHPFFVAANIPNAEYYQRVKDHIRTLSAETIAEVRYQGRGTRSFLIDLLDRLTARGERFYTLAELNRMLKIEDFQVAADDTKGRHTIGVDDEYQRYWSMAPEEKQEFLKRTYAQRDARDPYATSRDINVRELEIESIRRSLGDKGPILDLGCGNGYTLITLAKSLEGWPMVGIDFSESLITGAVGLVEQGSSELRSLPEFRCADAMDYIRKTPASSVRYLITERFLQNMPSAEIQREIIREVHRVLVPGGRLLMCEGSVDGFEALNDLRGAVGLPRIPATSKDNISAIRFNDAEIEEFARDQVGFTLRAKLGYSTYFVITRVLHPLLVAPQDPRFDAPINKVAREIQDRMDFKPGIGSNTLWVFEN